MRQETTQNQRDKKLKRAWRRVKFRLDSKKNHLELVTDYWPVYEKCIEQEEDLLHLRPEDFIVAIPRNQIVLVRRFDFTAYGSFPAKSAK